MDKNIILQKALEKSSKSVALIGSIILLLGIIVIIYPMSAGKIATISIGIILFIGGILRLSFAIFSTSLGKLILRYLFSLLMILVGAWLIGKPEAGLETVTLVLALFLIIDGITSIIYSFTIMPFGGGVYLLINGLIRILIGVLIWSKWPEASNYIIYIYLGVKIVIEGLALILTGRSIGKSIYLISFSNLSK
jgi:uncharacterized membrane protein HdeD (DUF308 family)